MLEYPVPVDDKLLLSEEGTVPMSPVDKSRQDVHQKLMEWQQLQEYDEKTFIPISTLS